MQLSDLDWKVRAALATSGIVFFFLVGLGAGTYFDRSAHTDTSRQSAALSPSISVPAKNEPPPPATAAPEKTAASSPDQAPSQAPSALPPVPEPRSVIPPPPPDAGEATASAPAVPSPAPAPDIAPPAPAPQPHPVASIPAPVPAHDTTARVALAAPPRPAVKPAASGQFRIQFGAFRHEENAKRLSRAITTPAMKVAVTLGKDHKGRPLYYVRSPAFADFARALAAAWDAQNRAQKQHFAEPITYLIRRVPAAEAAGTTEIAGGR